MSPLMDPSDDGSSAMAIWIWSFAGVLMTPIFLVPTWLLYRRRKEYPINCRSPLIACIGCVALYLDSQVNVVIEILRLLDQKANTNYKDVICGLGVMDTMSFHYIAIFAFYLRSYRIQKVMSCYKKYMEIYKTRKRQIPEQEGGQ